MFKKKGYRIRGPLPFRYVFLLSFVFFIFSTLFGIWFINKAIEPNLIKIAESETRQFATESINEAILNNISKNLDMNKMIISHNNGDDIGYSFNSKMNDRIILESNMLIQKYLDKTDSKKKNGIVNNIPLGMVTDNIILANLGPKIPIRYEIIGDVNSKIDTQLKESGINNTFLEVYINVNVQMNVIIPSLSKSIKVTDKVKLGDLFLQGRVPQFYNGGTNNTNPSINLPNKN